MPSTFSIDSCSNSDHLHSNSKLPLCQQISVIDDKERKNANALLFRIQTSEGLDDSDSRVRRYRNVTCVSISNKRRKTRRKKTSETFF